MIGTRRLILRRWRDADVAPFHAMGQDVEVMRYLGPPSTIERCRAIVAEQNAIADDYGRCFWAIERREDGVFLGFCGVEPGPAGTAIADLPEIGWRLARAAWGHGYATEAAQAALAAEWQRGVNHVHAITVPANTRSRAVMERLGMAHDPDGDFDHPALAPGDPLRRHVLYRIARPA
ncbi:GCN5 family acetyltransferase [Sphingomonas sp. Leaf412]|uniref:GNAT family N-acetyltransferase n=1 Tax=Sphingomonas sp. Leaf412 TaxID=1736370 RepID=UPI0006F82808|nr:GNAT family N-acetyltransferase [Sphingomonas sp. Leaf412]KQT32327.1 GCN5 family acetyltransferase [Sphingomonas sp. Leaf412]